jgi:hypothetical protein
VILRDDWEIVMVIEHVDALSIPCPDVELYRLCVRVLHCFYAISLPAGRLNQKVHSSGLHDPAEGGIMKFMRCQGDAPHRVRETSARNETQVVEPDQRLVIAFMAIGIIAGALLTPPSPESANSKTAAPVTATTGR